jgi:hypothetical protein
LSTATFSAAWLANKKPQSGARRASIPLRLLIKLSLRPAQDSSVALGETSKHLREAARIVSQPINRVKKNLIE